MYNTDIEILRPGDLDVGENNKKIQRKIHRNMLLETFYKGQRDEKYVQDYYELLKKGDEYLQNANARTMDLTADKNGMSFGRKDPLGRNTYEHLGFFDESHKNYGKTLAEVLNTEIEERRVKDDDYGILYMFNNKPIVLNMNDSVDTFSVKGGVKHNKRPILVNRKNKNILNKIEDITDYIHVKKIGFEHMFFEFFISKKYKLNKHNDDSEIFKDILDLNTFWYKDKYGELYGFRVDKFIKRIDFNQIYDVIKFSGIKIENKNK